MRARSDIAVGVVLDPDLGRVLLSRRPRGKPHAGYWEFPGGKCEPGEAPGVALRRELHEELGLDVHAATPVLRIDHDYPDRPVRLHVSLVRDWSGDPHGHEGQQIEWVRIGDLGSRLLLPANGAILNWLDLPSLYLVTPDRETYGGNDFDTLAQLLGSGARLLQFRNTHLAGADREAACRRVLSLCRDHGARMLLNGTPEEAGDVGAHGVHLNSARLMQLRQRPTGGPALVSASCHDRREVAHARRLGLDFIVLGPVKATASHSAAPALGWPGFSAIARDAGCPVYALGGMRPGDLGEAIQSGGRGLAMISGVWDAPDPVAAVRDCLRDPFSGA